MAYIEHDQLDAQLKKLENVCAENGFTYKFLRDKYPVRIIITPDGTMDGQMSMLDNPVGYNTKGSALAFVFVDGDVYLNPGKEGGLSLSKRLQNKLRTIAEKVYFNNLGTRFVCVWPLYSIQPVRGFFDFSILPEENAIVLRRHYFDDRS